MQQCETHLWLRSSLLRWGVLWGEVAAGGDGSLAGGGGGGGLSWGSKQYVQRQPPFSLLSAGGCRQSMWNTRSHVPHGTRQACVHNNTVDTNQSVCDSDVGYVRGM